MARWLRFIVTLIIPLVASIGLVADIGGAQGPLVDLANAISEWSGIDIGGYPYGLVAFGTLILFGIAAVIIGYKVLEARLTSGVASRTVASPSYSQPPQLARQWYLKYLSEELNERLKSSIHGMLLTDLPLTEQHQLTETWSHKAFKDPEKKKSFRSLAPAFKHFKNRMVVFGEPGAGKTTTLLMLARKLVAEAQRNDEAPIPIVESLSRLYDNRMRQAAEVFVKKRVAPSSGTLLDDDTTIQDRIAAAVAGLRQGLTADAVNHLIETNQVILLLDGLDEIGDEGLPVFSEFLNFTLLSRHRQLPILITSRTAEYQQLVGYSDRMLRVNGAVTLEPLTDRQIAAYLDRAEAEGLREVILTDATFHELARTPLMLSMMAFVYWGVGSDNIERGLSPKNQHLAIYDHFVDRMMQREAFRSAARPWDLRSPKRLPTLYSRKEIDRALGTLAVAMGERNRVRFSVDVPQRLLLVPKTGAKSAPLEVVIPGILMLSAVIAVALAAASLVAVVRFDHGLWTPLILVVACVVGCLAAVGLRLCVMDHIVRSLFLGTFCLPVVVVGSAAFFARFAIELGFLVSNPAEWILAYVLTIIFIVNSLSDGHIFYLIKSRWFGNKKHLIITMLFRGVLPLFVAFTLGLTDPWVACIYFSFILMFEAGRSITSLNEGGDVFNTTAFLFGIPLFWVGIGIAVFGGIRSSFAIEPDAPVLGMMVTATSVGIMIGFWAEAAVVAAIGFILALAVAESAGIALLAALGAVVAVKARHDKVTGDTAARLFPYAVSAWLALRGHLPWQIGRLLDYARRTFLLRRIGSEYEFMHLTLLNFFGVRELTGALSGSVETQQQAIEQLATQGAAAFETLVDCAQDPSPAVRAAALRALVHSSAALSPERILEFRRAEQVPELRALLIDIVPRLSMDIRGTVTLSLIDDPVSENRLKTAEYLLADKIHLDSEAALAVASRLLADPDPLVFREALIWSAKRDWIAHLNPALKAAIAERALVVTANLVCCKDAKDRRAALGIARLLPHEAWLAVLAAVAAYQEDNGELRREIIEMLTARLSNTDINAETAAAIRDVIQNLFKDTPATRAVATSALWSWPEPTRSEFLRCALADRNDSVRAAALTVIATSRLTELFDEALSCALADQYWSDWNWSREYDAPLLIAARAVAQIVDGTLFHVLKKAIKGGRNTPTANMAIIVLGAIGTPESEELVLEYIELRQRLWPSFWHFVKYQQTQVLRECMLSLILIGSNRACRKLLQISDDFYAKRYIERYATDAMVQQLAACGGTQSKRLARVVNERLRREPAGEIWTGCSGSGEQRQPVA